MDIPEILQKVASHLDPPSLFSASQVSKHWHTYITPLIWHTIHPQDWTHPAFRPRILYKQAGLVRELGWHAMTSSAYQQAIAAQVLQNMAGGMSMGTGLQLPGSTPPPPPTPPLTESSELSMTPFDVRKEEEETGDLLLTEQGQTETIAIAADNETRKGQVPLLLTTAANPHSSSPTPITSTVPPILEQLSLICLTKIVGQCTNLQRLCLHTTTITTYEFFGIGPGGGGIHLDMIPVLQSLVFLQSLELYVNRVVVYQDQDRDGKEGSKSKELIKVVEGGGIVVQDLVRRLNQLSRLSLRGTAFIFNTPPSSKSTLTSAEDKFDHDTFSIQHLTLDTPYISQTELTTLLTQCPRLESLDIPGGLATWTWTPSPSDLFLTALRTFNSHLREFAINSSAYPPIPEDILVALVRHGLTTRRPIRRFGARACQFPDGEIFLALLEQQETSLRRRSISNPLDDLDEMEGEESIRLEELDISLAKRVGPLFRERLYEFLGRAEGLKRVEAAGVWIALDDLETSNTDNDNNTDVEQQEPGQIGPVPPTAAGAGLGPTHPQQDQSHLPTLAQAQAQAQAQEEATPIPPPPLEPSPRARCTRIASSKTLTHLHIGFTHPTRTTPTDLHNMYNLLSTLTHLETLQLSYTCLTLPTSSSSLSAEQQHPFHALASLKHLHTFNIETCGYPILTRLDLEWMLQNWQRLQKLVLNQLGVSQERVIKGWIRDLGREDLDIESSSRRSSAAGGGMMYF